MAANREMSEWMLFFREAGVPVGPAVSYANTFVDNRIHKSMLMDLTKEYLKEMGIGVMGDVIAILKFAKTAYSKYERDRPALEVLPKPADGKVELKRKTTAGGRMLEHYLRKEGVMDKKDIPTKVKVSTEMAARLGAVPIEGMTKRQTSSPGKVEVIPMKRIRKVDPAEEGAYIISMPKGSTPRTQKILQKQAGAFQGSMSSSSVFSRLGGGNASASAAAMSAVKNTGASQQANVFNRLGGVSAPRKRSVSESSTTSVVEYQGVLKPSPITKQVEPKVVVTFGLQKDRLGIQKPEVSTTTVTHMDTIAVKPSLQARLGAQAKVKANMSNMQVHPGESSLSTMKSPTAQSRLRVHISQKANNPSLQQRKTSQVKVPSALQARLGKQKYVNLPKQIQTTNASPTVKKLIVTRPASSIQERLGASTGKTTPKKNSLADRLGGKVNTVMRKPSTTSAGILSTGSHSSMTLASDRAESSGVMKRLGIPVNSASSSQNKLTLKNRLGPPMVVASSTLPLSRANTSDTSRPNIRNRLGIQKAEASSTTPSLGLTVTTSGTGRNTVKAVGGIKRKNSWNANVGFDTSPKKSRGEHKASVSSGVFGRLGAAV